MLSDTHQVLLGLANAQLSGWQLAHLAKASLIANVHCF